VFEKLTLDDLVIRSSSHTSFFGVYLATHAIDDGLCMCHASVGCKVKTQQHLAVHDGVRDAHSRMRYSQFIDEDLINGSTAQLEEEIVAWHRRQKPGIVVIDGSTPISLQAQSMSGVIKRMEAATGAHVVFVPARNYESDYLGGYADTIGSILRRLEWDKGTLRAEEVSVIGHVFDRYEADRVGDVAELRRLLLNLGFKARAIFMSGETYASLREAVNARTHIVLPHARSQIRVLADLGREHCEAGLPMSIAGTKAWLHRVGEHLGVLPRAQAVVEHEMRRLKPLAELARRDLAGKRFALFADAPRAAGVAATLMEVGMIPQLIGTLHFHCGGKAEVLAALRQHHEVELPSEVEWLENPTPAAVRQAPIDGCDVVLGTTIERELLAQRCPVWIEYGFPSDDRHYIFPAPSLGFNGALRLWEQTMLALAQARSTETRRRSGRRS
jgi:nitrogenase molybdenum-iron protein alpha/beta subunit